MIVQLTGTVVETTASHVVLDVSGVGFELGISATTAADMPPMGTAGVRLLTRMVVREAAMELYGFATREERALFDRLVAISRVGPKLALSVLSTFAPATLATVVATQDVQRMSQVPGVGKRTAQRLLVDLEGVFAKDAELRGLVGLSQPTLGQAISQPTLPVGTEATEALLSMGFTSQEAELALEGYEDAGAKTVEAALAYALKRLGGGA